MRRRTTLQLRRMIPLSDGLSARRWPIVNTALIVANFAVWIFYELPHLRLGGVPCVLLSLHGRRTRATGPEPWGVSWITSMFLHGSWDHILGNMLFLAVFGKNVEDSFGHAQVPGLLLRGRLRGDGGADGDDAAVRHRGRGRVPNLGASGAIAAVSAPTSSSTPTPPSAALVVIFPVQLSAWFFLGVLVPLPALRGELRALRRDGERRRRRVLRPRRRVHLRRPRGLRAHDVRPARAAGRRRRPRLTPGAFGGR